MQKVGSTTDTADANGEWTNGNVAQGVSPTVINAAILNTHQRELVNIVESAGMQLDPNDDGQVLKAINKNVGGGRLLNVQKFTASGTYTPTPGTKSVVVEVQAAGGGGGGTPATGPTSVSASGAGGAGAYAMGRFTTGFVGVIVTVGVGGNGGVNATSGVTGGDSSFGSLISCPGGTGGGALNAVAPPASRGGSVKTATPVGGNIFSSAGGAGGGSFIHYSGTVYFGAAGLGAPSRFGCGGADDAAGTDGEVGAGGGGHLAAYSSPAINGGRGGNGIVLVWEYS